jgi:predicted transcriptional regulator
MYEHDFDYPNSSEIELFWKRELVVEATSNFEAIDKYIKTLYNTGTVYNKSTTLVYGFLELVRERKILDYDYFRKNQKAIKLAKEIYERCYIDKDDDEDIGVDEFKEYSNRILQVFDNPEEAFRTIIYNNVVCRETEFEDKYLRETKKSEKGIIPNAKRIDIEFYNLMLEIIREGNEKEVIISKDILHKKGVSDRKIGKIFDYLEDNGFFKPVCLWKDFGFRCEKLIDFVGKSADSEEYTFRPSPLLIHFARLNYDFRNGKDDAAIETISNIDYS